MGMPWRIAYWMRAVLGPQIRLVPLLPLFARPNVFGNLFPLDIANETYLASVR